MKKQFFLLLTLFVLFFNSCIKDKPEDLIIGDWNIASGFIENFVFEKK